MARAWCARLTPVRRIAKLALMVDDDLHAFESETPEAPETKDVPAIERSILVFRFADASFAVEARAVEAVIVWRKPTPLPQSDPWLDGVLQERGRIVSVLAHPTAGAKPSAVEVSRVVVCPTSRGLVGLPATMTETVDSVMFSELPVHAVAVDTTVGIVTYVDPEQLIQRLLG